MCSCEETVSCSNSQLCVAVKKLKSDCSNKLGACEEVVAEGVQRVTVHCTLCFSEHLLEIGEEST